MVKTKNNMEQQKQIKLAICDGQICVDARQVYELLGEYDYRRYQLAKQITSLPGRGGWVSLTQSSEEVYDKVMSRLGRMMGLKAGELRRIEIQ